MGDTVKEAVRQRLLRQNLNWWKGNNRELLPENINQLRNEFKIEYRPADKKFYNLRPLKVEKMLRCNNCIKKGVTCSGPTNPRMRMCVQCATAGLEEKDCVYPQLNLELPAWASAGGGGAGGAANAVIQPAEAGAGGAGLAIRVPVNVGRGSPTGFMEDVNEEEYNENATNSNASRDPTATAEQVARGRAKKEARRKKVANNLAKSALNNMAAGNESAKAVQAMAKAAGAGGKRSRKQKQKNLKRKQKFTRKQK